MPTERLSMRRIRELLRLKRTHPTRAALRDDGRAVDLWAYG